MTRLIGAALVISSAASMGFAGVMRLRGRVRSLSALLASLDMMEHEICSRLAPMGSALEKLSKDAPRPADKLYENALAGLERLGESSFCEIWSEAVEQTGALNLTGEEMGAIKELGLALGRYDAREQSESIGRVRSRMERFLREAERERDRDSRLHAFFGAASGVVAVLLLM